MSLTNVNDLQSSRAAALQRRIARYGRSLETLQVWDNRFSIARLLIFILGLAAFWLAAAFGSPLVSRLVGAAAVGMFIMTVALHRRLDRWIARYKIWREIQQQEWARLILDWENFPAPTTGFGQRGACASESLAIDLDLTGPRSLHHLLDLAVSEEGSARLAGWLCQGAPDLEQLASRQAIVRELAGMRRFRDRLLLNLRMVSRERLKGADLLSWLEVPLPAGRLGWLLLMGSLLVIVNLVLLVLNLSGALPPFWALTVVFYLGLIFGNTRTIGPFLEAVVDLDRALDRFAGLLRYLEGDHYLRAPHLAQLCSPFRDPTNLPSAHLRRIKWVTAAVGLRGNLIVWLLLSLILPWDFLCAWLADRLRRRVSPLLPAWLETWFQLEALISLGNFAALHPEYTFPEITASGEQVLSAQALGHPLIPAAMRICNDFHIAAVGDVAIITGSNMAGKSTFIKTVGVNLCLAYAGGPVAASSFRSLPLRLHTCIRISDSIADGFSYFYAEVKCLKRLLQALQESQSEPVLYLIDEIFRGTNNRERLLGSQAYIQALLGANGCGLIATHDLELAKLADRSDKVRNYHFRDAIAGGRLVFDYKLHPGPSPTTNALKIMALEGLPIPDLS
jgi:hypothetical protein